MAKTSLFVLALATASLLLAGGNASARYEYRPYTTTVTNSGNGFGNRAASRVHFFAIGPHCWRYWCSSER